MQRTEHVSVTEAHLCRRSLHDGRTRGGVLFAIVFVSLLLRHPLAALVFDQFCQLLAGEVQRRSEQHLAATTDFVTLLNEERLQFDRVLVQLPTAQPINVGQK